MPTQESDNPDRSTAINRTQSPQVSRVDGDAIFAREKTGRVVNNAVARYPINSRLDQNARGVFVEGMVELVTTAIVISGGRLNGFNFGLVFYGSYEPENEEQQQLLAAFEERLATYRQEMYGYSISPSKSGTKQMVNNSIQHVFLDSMDMITNSVETMEELRVKTRGRSSNYSQGRELHLGTNLPPSTRVVTLRTASNIYLPPVHR